MIFTKTTTTEKLSKRSTEITDVFTKTVQDLSLVNEEANKKIEENISAIAALQEENNNITLIADKNNRLVSKISEFLGE